MRTHLSSVVEENKLSDGSGNIGVCENPQACAGVGALAGAGKKPVCVKKASDRSRFVYNFQLSISLTVHVLINWQIQEIVRN